MVAEWGCYGTAVPPIGTGPNPALLGFAIGTGAENTAAILAACPEAGIAAALADNYSLNGFDDWFLPSNNELLAIKVGWGSYSGFLWTSTQWLDPSNTAMMYDMPERISMWSNKNLLQDVIPVRAF